MFRKIFLSFWLTVAVAAALLQMLALWQRGAEQRSTERMRALAGQARRVADAYERGDSAAAAGLNANVLDARGASIVNRPVTGAARETARTAARIAEAGFSGPFGDTRSGVVAQSFLSSSGRRYTVVAAATRGVIVNRSPYTGLVAVLVLGGAVCFFLARHFSAPLVRLGAAAKALADGRLDTRVDAALQRRRDEVGAVARDFDRMAERIEALVTAERRLLGDVSHELRSPLARLTVAVALAKQNGGEVYLPRIEREAERLDRLVGQLLTLARIESGVESSSSRFDLTELLVEVVSDGDFEARASKRTVELIAADDCVVAGAAELMRSAVENVVRNAIRHTAEGTTVEVTLRCAAGTASLSVRDHGSGLPDADLAQLFTPLRRAGLGVAIAERVVRLHGGTIRAANADGGGLVVCIELPCA